MIECYFSLDGYLIQGPGIEACRRVRPLTNENGEEVFDDIQHLFIVLFVTLGEIVGKELGYVPIYVYNDSRIIDDMIGHETLDDLCGDIRTKIQREIAPLVDGQIRYRKRSARDVQDKLNAAFEMYFPASRDVKAIHETQLASFQRCHDTRVHRLREPWIKMMEKKHGPS